MHFIGLLRNSVYYPNTTLPQMYHFDWAVQLLCVKDIFKLWKSIFRLSIIFSVCLEEVHI